MVTLDPRMLTLTKTDKTIGFNEGKMSDSAASNIKIRNQAKREQAGGQTKRLTENNSLISMGRRYFFLTWV